jgi:alpha-L-fucosidase 2
MNYWPADVANLSECFPPFSDYLWSIRETRRKLMQKRSKARGWVTQGGHGIHGEATWVVVRGGAAWFCQNLWDHYAFTGDKEYLRSRAYPILKEICEYWEDTLERLPDGTLVAPLNFSPEIMKVRDKGCTFDQSLVWELFTNTIEASKVLDVDAEFRAKLQDMRDKLMVPKIGRWGQLQEWMTDRDSENNHHRHMSHLVGLYPGRQVSPFTTPKLAEAAKVSLRARGDSSVSWGAAWRACLWARQLDGDHAYKLLNSLLRPVNHIKYKGAGGGVYDNLLDAYLGFQQCFEIDANFGSVAAVCEMLVQSQTGEIYLLPALPSAWPQGSVKGLRARGGFTVDIQWKEGKVTNYRVASREAKEVKVHANGDCKTILSEVRQP